MSDIQLIATCPIHGDYLEDLDSYLFDGCPDCRSSNLGGTEKRKSCEYPSPPKPKKRRIEKGEKRAYRVYDTPTFVKEAEHVHSRFYTYDKAEYTKSHTKLTVTCKYHGDFQIRPSAHLQGRGCRLCANVVRAENRKTRKG